MKTLRRLIRLLHIGAILTRYRLDDLTRPILPFRPLRWLPRNRRIAGLSRGERLRLALQDLGPVYVKFGQILSTRRDILPTDIADELALLQDRVPPFPGEQARAIVEMELGAPVTTIFREFSAEPLASASIAQVHPAVLLDGRDVVVKVVRPGIRRQLKQDIDLLKSLAGLAQKYMEEGQRIRPMDVVTEFETVVYDELDMRREAANASMLRRNWLDSPDLYIPEVFWSHIKQRVLVMERVSGLHVGDVAGLKAAGVNLELLAKRGIRVFYTQVFRDNLFHADMHPGNILVDAGNPEDPSFIALDFGIVASLSPKDLHYISENFLALFNFDYRRVAELHVEAGWVPEDTRIDEMEAAVRMVGEANFTRPLDEISFGEMLVELFRVAHRFKLTIQPQLIMLQKTLLNIEGLGRQLHPNLNIWAVAKPELEAIMREKYAPSRTARILSRRFPGWLAQAPEMPELVHEYLKQATAGKLTNRLSSADLRHIHAEIQRSGRQTRGILLALGLLVSGALLLAQDVGPWMVRDLSALGLAALGGGLLMGILSYRRNR